VLYNVIKDFQSGLVGILGFIGVIVTLLMECALSRTNESAGTQSGASDAAIGAAPGTTVNPR
jgi:hypothetical protein